MKTNWYKSSEMEALLKDAPIHYTPTHGGFYVWLAAQLNLAFEKGRNFPKHEADTCPQCKSPIIEANLGGGRIDRYCEDCGWPTENRQ